MNVQQLEELMLTSIERLEAGDYASADFSAAVRSWQEFAPYLSGGASLSNGITEEVVETYKRLHEVLKVEADKLSKDRTIAASLLNHVRTFWKLENINAVVESKVNVSDLKGGLLDSLMSDVHMGVPFESTSSKH
jgi:hypothetical protein